MHHAAATAGNIGTAQHILTIRCLGPFSVSVAEHTLHRWPSASAEELLAYLAVHWSTGASCRDLVDALWSGSSFVARDRRRGLSLLFVTVGVLRRTLASFPGGQTPAIASKRNRRSLDASIVREGERFRLDLQDLALDLVAFDRLTMAVPTPTMGSAERVSAAPRDTCAWRQAVQLYRRGLLAGASYSWVDEPRQARHEALLRLIRRSGEEALRRDWLAEAHACSLALHDLDLPTIPSTVELPAHCALCARWPSCEPPTCATHLEAASLSQLSPAVPVPAARRRFIP